MEVHLCQWEKKKYFIAMTNMYLIVKYTVSVCPPTQQPNLAHRYILGPYKFLPISDTMV